MKYKSKSKYRSKAGEIEHKIEVLHKKKFEFYKGEKTQHWRKKKLKKVAKAQEAYYFKLKKDTKEWTIRSNRG